MKLYKLIGLTGTTGAGKSAVADIFSRRGCAVISADILARRIMSNPIALSCIAREFGDDVVAGGELNRKLLAQRAFASREKTERLNAVTHPFIHDLFLKELKRFVDEGHRLIVFDASQLFESGMDVLCDLTVAVTAPEELRLRRVTERDGISEQSARARMAVQYSDSFFETNCDFVIDNSRGESALREQAERILSGI